MVGTLVFTSGAAVFVAVFLGMPLDYLALVASGGEVSLNFCGYQKDSTWQAATLRALPRQQTEPQFL